MNMKFRSSYLLTSILSIITIMILTGCVKKDPESHITQVFLAPLSPNSPSVDFVVNGAVYATGVGYSSTLGTIRYSLPYYTLEPKTGTVISYNYSGTTNPVASVTKDLEEDKVYSTYLIDSLSKAKAVIVNDNLSDPTPGKVKIRFFHFSANTPALDVVVLATSAKLFGNRTFNDQATNIAFESFIEVDPGIYTFLFNSTAGGANIYTTTAQTLLPDRIYTLAIRGFTTGTGSQAIGGWVYPNKP